MRFTPETARIAGRKGGQMTHKRHGRAHFQQIGQRGGTRTHQRHGGYHMQIIGRKGFHITCWRYFDGDRQAMLDWFTHAGLAAQDAHMPPSTRKWFPKPWPSRRIQDEE